MERGSVIHSNKAETTASEQSAEGTKPHAHLHFFSEATANGGLCHGSTTARSAPGGWDSPSMSWQ